VPALRVLVLTDDAETAVATADAGGVDSESGSANIVALSSATRAERVLRAALPDTAAISFRVAAALIGRSALPLTGVRHVIVAMPDVPGEPKGRDALDAVMGELPKDATRTLVVAQETSDVEALVARHFFKARRTVESASAPLPAPGRVVRVLATSPGARWDTLRRILDELDPASGVVVVDDTTREAGIRTLSTLGYGPAGAVRIAHGGEVGEAAVVLFVGIPDAAALRAALVSAAVHIVVLCAPREIASLRALAGTVPVTPLLLDGPRARAESREAATRARLREILITGAFARELLTVAPLLDEFDGSEIAAAALVHASEVQRAAAPVAQAAAPSPSRSAAFERGGTRPPRRDDRDAPRGGPRGAPRGPSKPRPFRPREP